MRATETGTNDTTNAADFARLVHEMSAPPFHDVLRPEPVRVDPGDRAVVVRLPFRAEFSRARDSAYYHGGVIASLIDLTAHAAVAIRVERAVPTIDLRIDYLRAAPGSALLATGRVLIVGASIGRADVEVNSEDGQLVAVGRGVFSTLSRTPNVRRT